MNDIMARKAFVYNKKCVNNTMQICVHPTGRLEGEKEICFVRYNDKWRVYIIQEQFGLFLGETLLY